MTTAIAFIKSTKFFPTVLIVLDIFSAIRYALAGDIRHCVYWVAAAILTAAVTY